MYIVEKLSNIKFVFLLFSIIVFFGGCTSELAKKNIPKVDLPTRDQVKNITKHTDTLRCMDSLYKMADDGTGPIIVYVEDVKNETANQAKIPKNFKTMLITAFNKLGSHVRVIDDSSAPYVIKAAVTEFDFSSSEGAGVYFGGSGGKGKGETDGDGRGGYKREIQTMAIDFNLLNQSEGSGMYEPYVSTSYKMELIKIEDSNDWGISIYGNGFGMNANVTKVQGIHSAIRLLLEVSLSELFGEFNILPYWECRGGTYDREFVDRIDYYYTKFNNYLPQIIATPLKNWGLLNANSNIEDGIIKFKQINNISPVDSEITFEMFLKLFTTIPPKKNSKKGQQLDLFKKYISIDEIKIYSEALSKKQELNDETYFEQKKRLDSLYRIFKTAEESNPDTHLQIISIVSQDSNIITAKNNITILKDKLIQKGISRNKIREISKKSNKQCLKNNALCTFKNSYLVFKIY